MSGVICLFRHKPSIVSQFFERRPPSRRSDFISSVRQAVGPEAMMTPTATHSAIADQLDDGTAITGSDVADHTSPIDQDGRDEASKDEASASTETNCEIHIKAKASTEQPSDRVMTVATSHSHDASVGGLTSSSDATGEEEETTDTDEEQINKERRRDPPHEVVDETDIKRSISRLRYSNKASGFINALQLSPFATLS
jgi:hypothetical protein